MNGIGITEWYDSNDTQPFPFVSLAGNPKYLKDASFVTFDGFVPVLKSIFADSDSITLTFTFDNGDLSWTIPDNQVLPYSKQTLRVDNRGYGTIVLAPELVEFYHNRKGVTVTVNLTFEPACTTSIPSKSGLFSLQGLTGSVSLNGDGNQFFNVSGNTVTWNAVSIPTSGTTTVLTPGNAYVYTSTGALLTINLTTGALIKLAQYNSLYSKLIAVGNGLYGIEAASTGFQDITGTSVSSRPSVSGSVYITGYDNLTREYDISTVPPTLLTVVGGGSITTPSVSIDAGILYASPTNANSTVLQLAVLDNTHTSVVSTSPRGVFTLDGNTTPGLVQDLFGGNQEVYGVMNTSTRSILFQLDPILGLATSIYNQPIDPELGTFVSGTVGSNVTVAVNQVVALKTINGQTPVDNLLSLVSDPNSILSITNGSPDVLTFSLRPSISDTVIKPTTTYLD